MASKGKKSVIIWDAAGEASDEWGNPMTFEQALELIMRPAIERLAKALDVAEEEVERWLR